MKMDVNLYFSRTVTVWLMRFRTTPIMPLEQCIPSSSIVTGLAKSIERCCLRRSISFILATLVLLERWKQRRIASAEIHVYFLLSSWFSQFFIGRCLIGRASTLGTARELERGVKENCDGKIGYIGGSLSLCLPTARVPFGKLNTRKRS